jgi:hypothetical protein
MYIIIFEDDSIRSIENLDKSILEAVRDNVIDVIRPKDMKLLKDVSDVYDLIWDDIKQI